MADDISSLIKDFKALRKKVNKAMDPIIKEIAVVSLKNIIKDTTKGKDVNGNRFQAYSKATIAIKGSSNVNLRHSGRMLKNLKARKKRNAKYIVGFSNGSEEQKALGHQLGTRKLPKREFIGISKRSRQTIAKIIKKRMKKLDL